MFTTPGGFYASSVWTKAGVGSCVHIKGPANEDFLFDCGVADDKTHSASHCFISHGHVDHVGSIILHARSKGVGGTSCKYYIPTECLGPLESAFQAFAILDGKDIPHNLIPISPGDTINVSATCFVKVFKTVHRVQSQGYAVFRRIKGSLLSEYRELGNADIGKLKRAGVKITGDDIERLELVYTGDTTFEGLLLPENNFVFHAPMLFVELTYLDRDKTAAEKYGHIHISDIVANAHLFHNNYIVFCHISPRYQPAGRIIKILKTELPRSLQAITLVNLRSFGKYEDLTQLLTNISCEDRNKRVGEGWATPAKDYWKYRQSSFSGSRSCSGKISYSRQIASDERNVSLVGTTTTTTTSRLEITSRYNEPTVQYQQELGNILSEAENSIRSLTCRFPANSETSEGLISHTCMDTQEDPGLHDLEPSLAAAELEDGAIGGLVTKKPKLLHSRNVMYKFSRRRGNSR